MTIAKLVVEIEARNRSLKSVLADSSRGVNSFVREIEKANKAVAALQIAGTGNRAGQMFGPNPGQLAEVRRLTSEIISNYKAADKELRKIFKAGDINTAEFFRRGSALAESTVNGARAAIESRRGILGDEIANTLLGNIEKAVSRSATAVEKGARNIKQVQRALDEVDAGRDRAFRELDTAIGQGRVSAAERTMRRAEIIARRNEDLIRRINELEAKGQMRPALREAAFSQIDPKGFGIGLSRTEAEKVFQDAERQIGLLQRRMQQTIARTKLDLAAGLDPREGEKRIAAAFEAMNRGLEHGRQRMIAANTLTPEVERLLSKSLVKVPVVKPDLTQAERIFQETEQLIGRIQGRLKDTIARTKLDIVGGLDPREGARRIAAAGEAANNSILQVRRAIQHSLGEVPADINELLAKNIVKVGTVKPDMSAVERTFREVKENVTRARTRLVSELAEHKLNFLSGAIDAREFQRNIRDSFQVATQAVKGEMQRLQQSGAAVTPEIHGLLNRTILGMQQAAQAANKVVSEEGVRAARNYINGFKNTYTANLGLIRQALASGSMGLHEAAFRKNELAASFNASLEATRRDLDQKGLLTPRAAALIDRQMKNVTAGVAKTLGESKVLDGLTANIRNALATMNAAIGQARGQQATGGLSSSAVSDAIRKARLTYNKELQAMRDDLEAKGLVTPAALELIDRQFVNVSGKFKTLGSASGGAGASAAVAFFSAFDIAMAQESSQTLIRMAAIGQKIGVTFLKFVTLPIAASGAGAAKLAGDAEQSAKRLQISFGPASVQLQRNLNALRKEIPATSSELQQMASRLGELIIPIGLSSDKVAEMSTNLIKVTKNISLFSGVSSDRAFNAVINGLVGQSRELKKLGIEIDDATIRDRAYREGIARTGAQLSTLQKVQAGYIVIMERTRLIEGTLAQSQGTFNVRMLFFVARLKEAGIAIGTILLPFLTRFLTIITNAAERLSNMSETQRKWIVGLGIALATIGPLLIALSSLTRALVIYRAAVIAAQVAMAAGGVEAGALGLGAILAVGGPVAAVIGTIAAAIGVYALAMSGANKETDTFIANIAGMSKAALQASKVALTQAIAQNQSRMISLQASGVREQIDAMNKAQASGAIPPTLTGGTDAQRKEFARLREETNRWKNELGLIGKEVDKITDAEKQAAVFAKAYEEQMKAVREGTKAGLLTEEIAKAKEELQGLRAAGAEATKAFTVGRRTEDLALMNKGLEKARETLGNVNVLLKTFTEARKDPQNKPIADKLDIQISRARTLAIAMQGIIDTAEKTEALKEFGVSLAEVRKQLELATRTEDVGGRREAFTELALLQDKVQKALTDAVAKGDTILQERLRTLILSIGLLRVQFKTMVPLELFQQIDAAIDRAKLLQDVGGKGPVLSTGVPLDRFDEAQEHLRNLHVLNVALASDIVAQVAAGQNVNRQLNEQRKLVKEISDLTPNVFEDMFGPDFLPRLSEITAAVNRAQADMQDAQLFGDQAAAEKAHLNMLRALADLGRLRQALVAVMNARGISPEVQNQVLAGFAEAYRKLGGSAEDFAAKVDKGSRRLIRLGQLVAVVRQISEAFGLTGGNIDKAITSLGTMLTSIEQLRKANAEFEKRRKEEKAKTGKDVGRNFEETVAQISAVVGIAVSAFNFVSSIGRALFGKSQTEIEHDRILQENNARLADLKLSIDGWTGSIGDQIRTASALQNPRALQALQAGAFTKFIGNFGKIGTEQINAINANLKQFGISWEQIMRIAKDNGIQLLDSKGRIVAGAFDQLAEAIKIAREHFFDFANTLDEQRKKADLFNNVFNVPEDNGARAVNDNLGFLAQLAPEIFNQFFKGIDLSDATAVEKALQALTQALLSGALEATDSLKLLDKDELIAIISATADGLDQLRDATDSLTDSMLNVPTWFKLEPIRFANVDFREPPPNRIQQATATEGVDAARTVNDFSIGGDVIINVSQQPGESTDDLVDKVVARIRRRNFLDTGSSASALDN